MQLKSPSTIALLLCHILLSAAAFALCPGPQIKANGEFFKADLVFTGKVLSEHYVERGDNAWWYYRIRLWQVLKGPALKEVTVYTEDASSRFPLEIGSDYLLFADRRRERFWIDSCGNSALLSEAAESLDRIKSISKTKDGEIEGWLFSPDGEVDLSGIHVVLRCGPSVYNLLTDNHGYFRFRAPPGKYRVDFRNREYTPDDFGWYWYEPAHFVLHPGESAALLLTSVRRPAK